MNIKRKFFFLGLANLFFIALVTVYKRYENEDLYSTVMSIVKNQRIMFLYYFFSAYLLFVMFYLSKEIFFGDLRIIELENLNRNITLVLFDFIISVSVFKENFVFKRIFLVCFLAGMKIIHGILVDRICIMEQLSLLPNWFYLRINTFLTLFGLMIIKTFFSIKKKEIFQIFIQNELLLLFIKYSETIIKYLLNYFERKSSTFEEKSVIMNHVRVLSSFLKFSVNLYSCILFIKKGMLMLSILKKIFLEIKDLFNELKGIYSFWKILYKIRTKFPNATKEELRSHPTCLICRMDMDVAKKLSCGHLFHFKCLKSWIEKHNSCPTCRMEITPTVRNEQNREIRRRFEEEDINVVLREFDIEQVTRNDFFNGEPPTMLSERTVESILQEENVLFETKEEKIKKELSKIQEQFQRENERIQNSLKEFNERIDTLKRLLDE